MVIDDQKKQIKRFLRHTQTDWGHSKWEALERCPREYAFRYVHKIRPTIPFWEMKPAAALGTILHRGLAALYWLEGDLWRAVIDGGPEAEALKLEGLRLVQAYIDYWNAPDGDTRDWDKVAAVERRISGEVQHAPFTGRCDMVVKRRKDTLVVDHKSSARSGSDTEFALSNQFLGMLAVWKGKKRPAIIINRIIKGRDPSFYREEMIFPERKVEAWKRDLVILDGDLGRCERHRYYPRKRVSCQGRYGACEYFNLCHMGKPGLGEFRVPTRLDVDEALA